ncbi:MAG: zinc-ribbon and DUF3426 domain-containing protein [Wenzhouxiangella sp.]
MPVYTRCPACDATYELQVQELAEAAGVVRCSNCGKTFNSLAFLFEQRPEQDQQPLQGAGMPPLLAHRVFLQHEIPGLDERPEPSAAPEPEPEETGSAGTEPMQILPAPRPRAWMAAAGVLLLALAVQLSWLIDLPGRLSRADAAAPVAPQEAITLVARDLHPHPSLPDAVIISAVLRNRIATPVELPILELRLYDTSNQVLGVRRFDPPEYLPPARRPETPLQPGEELPIIVEVLVTGSQPAGFEFRYFQDA